MASTLPTTSRRAMLGTIAAISAAAAVPVTALEAQLPSIWKQREATFIAARNAENIFDRTIAKPHWARFPGPTPGGDQVTAQSDKLCDARCEAEEALIFTPAPSLSAVIWKITYARERWADFEDWPDGWWEAVLSDLRRLDGGLH